MKLTPVRKLTALLALILGISAPSFVVAQTAPTTTAADSRTDEKAPVSMEKFEVTGSRIKRLDAETVNPVLDVSVAKIEAQGFTTLGDALRALPFNNGQALTPMDSGTSFTPGVSTINLRGLGNNNTLVLINGRRAVPYASPGFNGFQTVFDLNSIPDSAIEKVEILKDGGSAIYGSDAVAGVVNIKLRRDFQGVGTSLTFGNYFNTDGLVKKASVIVGTNTAKTSMVTTFDFQDQHSVFARDLPFSRNADLTSVAASSNLRYTATGWADAGYSSEAAYLTDVGATDAIADGWADQRSSRGFPGYVVVGGRQYTYTTPTATPTVATAVPGVNYYNFSDENGMFPEFRRYSFYTTLKHDFTDNFYGFADFSFSRSHSVVYSAAAPADIETSLGLSAASQMIIPSYNPYNPWAVDISSGRRRMVEVPNRINDVTADTPRVLVGLGGNLNGSGMLSDWTWEAGALYSKNSVSNISQGAVADSRLQEALMGLTQQGNGSLAWNPNTPQADRVYFNWFGLNNQPMADFITVSNPNSASLEYWNYDVSVTGSLFELPAGPVKLAVGAEHRLEKMSNIKTDLNATGDIVGGDEGTSSFGQRDVTSVYAETDVPIIAKKVEVQLAGRFENYSDKGFAQTVRPKVGFKYRVTDWLALRGSYSKSFKAPDLAYLYTAAQTTFTSGKVPDPVTNTQIDQLQVVVQGNPDLRPELTDTYYAGLVVEPQKWGLKGFEASVDWFDYKQKNLLAQLSDYYGYAEFLSQAAAGNPIFAGKVVRDPTTNQVLYVRDDYVNLLTGSYRGVDMAANYTWKTRSVGDFYVGADGTWVDKIYVDTDNIVGGYLSPRWNATGQINWTRGDWGASLFGIYRGARDRNVEYGSIFDAGDTLYISYRVKAQFTLNASVSYRGLWKTKITVGGTNVLNQTPPVDPMSSSGTTDGINDGQPAFWFVRLDRAF